MSLIDAPAATYLETKELFERARNALDVEVRYFLYTALLLSPLALWMEVMREGVSVASTLFFMTFLGSLYVARRSAFGYSSLAATFISAAFLVTLAGYWS